MKINLRVTGFALIVISITFLVVDALLSFMGVSIFTQKFVDIFSAILFFTGLPMFHFGKKK